MFKFNYNNNFIVYNIFCFMFAVKARVDIRNRPRIPIPDEDPYSVAGSGSSGASSKEGGVQHLQQQLMQRRSDKPPKLPPRDANGYPIHDIPKVSSYYYNTTVFHEGGAQQT
jgi:hypothetical protein